MAVEAVDTNAEEKPDVEIPEDKPVDGETKPEEAAAPDEAADSNATKPEEANAEAEQQIPAEDAVPQKSEIA